MTSMGCAARKQKMIPWILVEMRSSGMPIMLSTLSANDVNDKKKKKVLIYYNDTVNLLILVQTTHTQKTAEGDGRRQGSKVDKDNCSKNLGV